jgi:hypothetical protein
MRTCLQTPSSDSRPRHAPRANGGHVTRRRGQPLSSGGRSMLEESDRVLTKLYRL